MNEPASRPGAPHRMALVLVMTLAWSCTTSKNQVTPHDDARPALRVVAYNIKHAHGMDGTVDLNRIADVLQPLDADVICLQEVDRGCARSGGVDQPKALGAALGMAAYFGAFRPYDGGQYGMAILTSMPVEKVKRVPLPPGPNPIGALEIQIEYEGKSVIVTGLHLVTTEAQRLAQAQVLLERYDGATQPVILAGDLNSERGSVVLDALTKDFDAPTKPGTALTFPSVDPVKEIDFVLLSPRGAWAIAEHRVIDERVASDHRPVLLTTRPLLHHDPK